MYMYMTYFCILNPPLLSDLVFSICLNFSELIKCSKTKIVFENRIFSCSNL